MAERNYSEEEIFDRLEQVDNNINQGMTAGEAIELLDININTYYRWRRKYSHIFEAKNTNLIGVREENLKLRNLVIDLTMENSFMRKSLKAHP